MRFCIFFLLFSINVLSATEGVLSDEKREISFYRGHLLWQDCLQRPGMSYDFEEVLAGMRAAEKGEKISYDEEKLRAKIREFQEQLLAKQTEENLVDAEAFLAKIAQEDAIEVIQNKLYCKQLTCGSGRTVQSNSTPILTYSVWTYNRWGEEEILSMDSPIPITLQDTIPGFAEGVVGMKEGEVRQLFIHPELAYGTYGKLDPNLLVIFKVEVICADDKEGT